MQIQNESLGFSVEVTHIYFGTDIILQKNIPRQFKVKCFLFAVA